MADHVDQGTPRHDAPTVLQVAAVIAAVAIALVALADEQGPRLGDDFLVPSILLVSGLLAVIGSLYAVGALWEEAGMSVRDALGNGPRFPEQPPPNVYLALVCSTWGLWLLGAAYFVLLLGNAP